MVSIRRMVLFVCGCILLAATCTVALATVPVDLVGADVTFSATELSLFDLPQDWGGDLPDLMSRAVATGDLNADGIDDILVCIPKHAQVYVFFGTPSVVPGAELPMTPDAIIETGAQTSPGRSAWMSVATGDVTGDAVTDIVFGACSPITGEGRVGVVPGDAGFGTGTVQPAFVVGDGGVGWMGFSVSCSDVSGDGTDDILTGSLIGMSFVILGSPRIASLPWTGLYTDPLNIYDVAVASIEPSCGPILAALDSGDLNGDGTDDIVLGELMPGEVSKASVFFGGKKIGAKNPIGLTHDGSNLWCIQAELDFPLEPELMGYLNRMYKLDSLGNVLDSMMLGDTTKSSQVFSVTFDGANFWGVDYVNQTVVEFTSSGQVVSSFDCSFCDLAVGIAYDTNTGNLWISDVYDEVYEVTTSGSVVKSFSELSLDLAFDGTYLWTTLDIMLRVLDTDGNDVATYWVEDYDTTSGATFGGVCFDGTYIWFSVSYHENYLPQTRYFKIATDGTLVETLDGPNSEYLQADADFVVEYSFDPWVYGEHYYYPEWFFGREVFCCDVNGDNYDDLLLPGEDSMGMYEPWDADLKGVIHVFHGSASLSGTKTDADADVELISRTSGDLTGSRLAFSDVNGDDAKDLLIGAPDAAPFESSGSGRVCVFLGPLAFGSTVEIDDADIILNGINGMRSEADQGDRTGSSIAVGDFNDDGYKDIFALSQFAQAVTDGPEGQLYGVFGGELSSFRGRESMLDEKERLFVSRSDGLSNKLEVLEYDSAGNKTLFADLGYASADYASLALADDGSVYVALSASNVIRKYTPDGSSYEIFADQSDGLDGVGAPEFDTEGNLFVSNHNACNILKIDPTGTATVFAEVTEHPDPINPHGQKLPAHPWALAFDSRGYLYASVWVEVWPAVSGGTVQRFDPSGNAITFAYPMPDGFYTPTGIRCDSDDNLYVASCKPEGYLTGDEVILIEQFTPAGERSLFADFYDDYNYPENNTLLLPTTLGLSRNGYVFMGCLGYRLSVESPPVGFFVFPPGFDQAVDPLPAPFGSPRNYYYQFYMMDLDFPSASRAAIESPESGDKIKGNSVTIEARLASGTPAQTVGVRFQYRAVGAGSWTDIPPATGETNPDTVSPYSIHWDTTAVTDDWYELCAVAEDVVFGVDDDPGYVTVEVKNGAGKGFPAPQQTPVPESGRVIEENVVAGVHQKSTTMRADRQNRVTLAARAGDGVSVTITIPPDALSSDTMLDANFVDTGDVVGYLQGTESDLGAYFDLSLRNAQTTFPPGKEVQIRVAYPDSDDDGVVDDTSVDERTVTVKYLDTGGGTFSAIASAEVSEADNVVDATTIHFTTFGLLGDAVDSDGDGIPDAAEDTNRNGVVDPGETDPLSTDSDGDGIPDGLEDANHNGVWDGDETNAADADTDGDGIDDGDEDADHDGVVDAGETDPRFVDTDGDSFSDGEELDAGTNPLDAEDHPDPTARWETAVPVGSWLTLFALVACLVLFAGLRRRRSGI